ncbi:MAG: methyl-accepting chemotaxis protein [Candidatus Methanoperedenaceae archaeon]|nr:MAG: methyl-accepting chemotaxis protein [Candidatus Methanoperedenaceae archaeon]
MNQDEIQKLDDYISPQEREHLLNGLHRYLIWVGEKVPEEVQVDGENIKVHELIWRCIHKKDLSEEEKKNIMELVENLETKAKNDEEVLLRESLTREEAKRLYNEIASFIRAIMDLRECEAGRIKLIEPTNEIKQKVDDARRWIGFLKNVGKKSPI